MFGKSRDSAGRPPLPADGGENPWDVATLAKICQSDKIGFRIRHVESRFRDGAFGQGKEFRFAERQVVGVGEIDGCSQFVHVEVTFQQDMREFGAIVLDYLRISQKRDSDSAKSRTAVSLSRGQLGGVGFRLPC